ncbi:hypothetical protein [Saccharothrix sp.]|uniref:hypothetical protein n=1 Tax=Saccharothrix sp. TaxID=1873460 RepID=UPI00281148BB|nr:hypothetical protein [Saccharothrix sp.]
MENPWATPAGLRAQQVRLTHLAAGSGEIADFAREVVAGRASTRDLLYASALSDRALQPVRDLVEQWHRLSAADRARLEAEAANDVEDRIAALNTLPDQAPPAADAPPADQASPAAGQGSSAADRGSSAADQASWARRPVRRRPDDPDPDEGRTFMSDAW